ncbi:MAG: hypothetical protein KDF54_16335, partial [Hydrogenophaga sp.]|nr:hypothetical protein [Hydrogenophaga sp.]
GEPGAGTMIQKSNIPNLSVLTAGPTPPDPVELLMGPKFQLLLEKAHELGYNQVIIDSPPLLGIADAVVLGNQIPHVVFTIKAGSTRKSAIKDALRRLRHGGISPMGVVLTHVNDKHGSDYGYGSYYGYDAEPAARTGLGAALAGGRGGEGGSFAARHAAGLAGLWSRPWLTAGAVAGVLLMLMGGWWLGTGSDSESGTAATSHTASEGTIRQDGPVASVAMDPALPSGATAAPVAVDPVVVDASATTAVVASASASVPPAYENASPTDQVKMPDLAALQDRPQDIWPPLGRLWGVKLNPSSSCESALSLGVQCFRQVGIGLPELRALRRPGLVQLKQDGTKRWVLLRKMDGDSVSLESGDNRWQMTLDAFQKAWTGSFTTLWKLPPGYRERVFVASESDPAGRWLNEQLRLLQSQQKLAATDDSLEARVSQFQEQHQMPRDGKAMPPVFVLVNLTTGVDEPRL